MALLTINPQGTRIEAIVGISILENLLKNGIEFPHKCNGQAKCGTCHIFVQEGRKSISKISRLENEKLDTIVGVGSKSRLACQTLMGEEPVTIEVLGFGSGL